MHLNWVCFMQSQLWESTKCSRYSQSFNLHKASAIFKQQCIVLWFKIIARAVCDPSANIKNLVKMNFFVSSQKETFRVYVVLPLLPAFEGEIGANGGYAIQAVLHWNYKSISKGENSLWQQLQKRGRLLFLM